MSAAAKKTTDAASTEVLVPQDAGLPAFASDMEDYAGAGTSTALEDTGIPFLYIAQKGSPEVNKQDPLFIKGLEVGDLYCRQTRQFWPGSPTAEAGNLDQALRLIPFAYHKYMVEWKPDRGGYVETHEKDTALLKKALRTDKGMVLPSGNNLIETDYHFCILPDGSPIVAAMSSTQLSGASRPWINLRNSIKIPNTTKIAPAFSRAYRVETRYNKNEKGDWYMFHIADEGWVKSREIYDLAVSLYEKSKAGLLKVAQPEAAGGGSSIDDESIPV